MKRLVLSTLFLASAVALGCSSDADPSNPNPGGAGTGTAGTSTAGTAGASGASTAGAAGTAIPGGGSAGTGTAGAGGGTVTEEPVVPGGVVGDIMGTIGTTNQVWGPGEISLKGPVTIPAGVTLTINRGTHIKADPLVPAPITATGGGVIKCNGIVTDPVTLFGTSVVLTGGSHPFQYCILNSPAATAIDVNGAQLVASHLQVQSFLSKGVYVHGAGAKATIDFSTIGSRATLFTADDATKEGVAVVIDADAGMNGSSITNSVLGFLNNATNTGLKINGPSNTVLKYDNITGPGSVMTSSVAPVGILIKEPMIADIPNLDHNLQFFSPDLDQADPAADFSKEPAPNGGRANLGYHGGTALARVTTVHILSPNGCESLMAGANTVTWESSINTGAKKLELSTDNGATWMPLATIAAGMDTHSMSVMLPSIQTDQAKLRFSQDNDPMNIKDESDRVFAIGKPKNAAACANLRPPCTTGCKPFKVICYTGYRSGQFPNGMPGTNEPTQAQVTEDIGILKEFTHGIRTYGSNPLLHDGKFVPAAADAADLDLHMGIWIDDSYTEEVNKKALDDSIAIVKANHKSIKTLIISNEYLLRVRQSFGDTVKAEARLVGYLNYVRAALKPTFPNLPIVIGESYPDWLNASKALYDAVDIVMWHVHPWWQKYAIKDAAAGAQKAHEAVLAKMKALGVTKPTKLAETGYPWGASTGDAVGSEANQAQYLHDINQYSLRTNLEYWFFEGFDEDWKAAEGEVGAKWGIFTDIRGKHQVMTNINTLVPAAEGWTRN